MLRADLRKNKKGSGSKDAFAKYDADGSGELSLDEFVAAGTPGKGAPPITSVHVLAVVGDLLVVGQRRDVGAREGRRLRLAEHAEAADGVGDDDDAVAMGWSRARRTSPT